MRPRIVGAALQRLARDPEVAVAMFEILETQKVLEGSSITVLPPDAGALGALLAPAPPSRKG